MHIKDCTVISAITDVTCEAVCTIDDDDFEQRSVR